MSRRAKIGVIIGLVFLGVLIMIGALVNEVPDRPILVRSEGRIGLTITLSSPHYKQAKRIVGGDGVQRVTAQQWQKLEELYGQDLDLTPAERVRQARWQEQFKVHRPNLVAFHKYMVGVAEDRVTDASELEAMCFLVPQWEHQLEASVKYVDRYREVEPTMVAANPMLDQLEADATAALVVVNQVAVTCP
jgi:hypothetical protein